MTAATLAHYVSQLGPDGLGHDRCAPACLASYLLDRGWDSDPWLLLSELAGREGPLAADHPHDAEDVIRAAEGKGFSAKPWTLWPQLEAAFLMEDAGVFALVDNGVLLPTAYPNAPGWRALHWIRPLALQGDFVICDDPLTYLPQPSGMVYRGPTLYTIDSVRAAIMATPVDYAGVLVFPRMQLAVGSEP